MSSSDDNDEKDLVAALSTRTKAAALMASMPAPPRSQRTLFLEKYGEYTPQKALSTLSSSINATAAH